ncbi:MAG: PTS sugar transporter subunit IIA [Desulfatibacillum sp.]|nr:PTS sugar transporter subunit IIA [Desulfatibacillum sp.]
MNIRQAADYLNLPVQTLQRWIAQGFLPAPAGASLAPSFEKDWLTNWAKSKNLSVGAGAKESVPKATPARSLVQALERGGVFTDVQGDTVDEALAQAAVLSPVPRDHLTEFTRQLLDRERLCSTGQGKGVAIPHARRPIEDTGVEASITTCFLNTPLDFKAIDGKPVSTLFLLISPSVDVHLHLLSRLAFCLRDNSFVDFLSKKPLPVDLLAMAGEFEAKVAEAGL